MRAAEDSRYVIKAEKPDAPVYADAWKVYSKDPAKAPVIVESASPVEAMRAVPDASHAERVKH